jgi:hypothetical protein
MNLHNKNDMEKATADTTADANLAQYAMYMKNAFLNPFQYNRERTATFVSEVFACVEGIPISPEEKERELSVFVSQLKKVLQHPQPNMNKQHMEWSLEIFLLYQRVGEKNRRSFLEPSYLLSLQVAFSLRL